MSQPHLPCPGVHFSAALLARVERCVARVGAARTRREGAGRGRLAGVGEEFVGHRPYRPGEDLRRLDWNLYARLDQPHVRITRREASEAWVVLLDTSASMGVGPPGKLQRGAEVALALASLGQRRGARVRLVESGGRAGSAGPEVAAPGHMAGLVTWLAGLRADGGVGIGAVLGGARARGPGKRPASSWAGRAGRIFLIGDLLDVEPAQLGALAGARRGTECHALQLLAPVEFAPQQAVGADGTGQADPPAVVEWRDAESGARLRSKLDQTAAYELRLEDELERQRAVCAAHGLGHVCHSTRVPFEELVGELLGM